MSLEERLLPLSRMPEFVAAFESGWGGPCRRYRRKIDWKRGGEKLVPSVRGRHAGSDDGRWYLTALRGEHSLRHGSDGYDWRILGLDSGRRHWLELSVLDAELLVFARWAGEFLRARLVGGAVPATPAPVTSQLAEHGLRCKYLWSRAALAQAARIQPGRV